MKDVEVKEKVRDSYAKVATGNEGWSAKTVTARAKPMCGLPGSAR